MSVKGFLLKLIMVFLVPPLFIIEAGGLDSYSGGVESSEFKDYWYSGKAEITSYRMEQARYGELHGGYAVLVFVTEDFSKRNQVKLDDPEGAGGDAVKVLKLNKIKKFDTGIYDYSMMNSVFTPVHIDDYPNTLKISSSSQEWCGNTYKQLNLTDEDYKVRSYSYFESEGDGDFNLDREFLEDEIWTRIRLDPGSLPVGEIKMIPGVLASRLSHRELRVETARASLREHPVGPGMMDYRIEYPEAGRSLEVTFEESFPFEIVSWEETSIRGFGENARKLTTRAVRNKTLVTDYWNKNSAVDKAFKEELGI